MILQEFSPPAVLADTVQGITVLEVSRLPGSWSIPLVAKAMPSIVYLCTGEGSKLLLYGQNIAPIVVRASERLLMIAWFLRPHRLAPLFGFRADAATDIGVPLEDLPRVQEMGLMERLALAEGLSGRLRLMDEFLVGLCAVAREGNRVAGYAARAIVAGYASRSMAECEGRMTLRSLQEELRVTERSLQRLFAEHVGVSPKVFSRICQFQPAFRQLSAGNFARLSDIAYDNGYADQSHLIRVFREFTGFTPGEYLERTSAFLEAVAG
jgi:AraC-like DNA-binding protein